MADEENIERLSIVVSESGAEKTANSLDKVSSAVDRLLKAIEPTSQHFERMASGIDGQSIRIVQSVDKVERAVVEMTQSTESEMSKLTREYVNKTALLEEANEKLAQAIEERGSVSPDDENYTRLNAAVAKADETVRKLEASLSNIASKAQDIQAAEQPIDNVSEGINETSDSVIELNNNVGALNSKFFGAFDNAKGTISETTSSTENLNTAMDNIRQNSESLTPALVTPLERLQAQIDGSEAKINQLQVKWIELANAEDGASVVDRSKIAKQLDDEEKKLDKLREKYEQVSKSQSQGGGGNDPKPDSKGLDFSKLSSTVSMFDSKLGGVIGKAGNILKIFGKYAPYLALAVGAFKGLQNIVKQTEKTAKALGKALLSIGKFAIDSIGKKVSKLMTPIETFIKQVKRVVLNRLIREGFNMIQNGVAEGIKNIAQGYEGANKVLSLYATQNMYLKNVLASAIIPLLQKLYPLFELVTNAMIKASNALNQFLSLLNGKSTYIKAKKQYVDYASTIDKSSKKAKKSVQNLTAGFDELNDITESATDTDGEDFTAYFSEANIESNIDDFYKRVIDGFKKGDLSDVGKIIADKINREIVHLQTKIQWSMVGNELKKKARALATLFSSLAENIRFDNIGKTIGDGLTTIINTILEFENTLAQNDFFGNLGKDISDLLYYAVMNINWQGLGEIMLNKLIDAFTVLRGFTDRMLEEVTYTLGSGKDMKQKTAPRIVAMIDTIFNGFANALEAKMNDISEIGTTIGNFLIMVFEAGTAIFQQSQFWDNLAKALNGIIDKLIAKVESGELSDAISNFIIACGNAATRFLGSLDTAKLGKALRKLIKDVFGNPEVQTALYSIFSEIGKITGEVFKTQLTLKFYKTISEITAAIGSVVGWLKNVFSWATDRINGVSAWTSAYANATAPQNKKQKFATGGFPEDGLFYANHNELVGGFTNGKTAVANNSQIISGIENASYSGLSKALAENGSQSRQGGGNVYFDRHKVGKWIAEDVAQEIRRGAIPLTVR